MKNQVRGTTRARIFDVYVYGTTTPALQVVGTSYNNALEKAGRQLQLHTSSLRLTISYLKVTQWTNSTK